ncbi:lipoprotein [Kaistia sp. 32K]|uniref:hypothetical protein n=1 Tax=Kaistia sp. 32K TaxID=2795690 RepID=UPI001915B355|nr:hypothetical protein [Kaistia sp. 32K]BCP54869.1 lipoprotein [Kaistia sp. 32K]
MKSRFRGGALVLLVAVASLGGAPGGLAIAQEKLVAPERNPPGDIPDDQVFIDYQAPAGFKVKVPEGWSRVEIPNGTRFFDKYDQIEMIVGTAAAAPKAASARADEVAALEKSGHAVKLGKMQDVRLKGGPALRIAYLANSEPNAVTGKQVRLEHERFVFFNQGKTITLDLAAPAGADNADQWQLISNSLRWP